MKPELHNEVIQMLLMAACPTSLVGDFFLPGCKMAASPPGITSMFPRNTRRRRRRRGRSRKKKSQGQKVHTTVSFLESSLRTVLFPSPWPEWVRWTPLIAKASGKLVV